MAEPSPVRLSVVIPAFNEEGRLPSTLDHAATYLSRQSFAAEVLVVDDGSRDATADVVRRLAERTSVPLFLQSQPDGANHGKGAAVRLGMTRARGEFLLFMDADNSTTLDQVERFWPWFERGYDVVIGSRNVPGSLVPVRQARYKELAGRAGNWIIRAMAVPGIRDTQAGFKMFTRRAAETVFSRQSIDRWGADDEILAIARIHGLRVREVPITWINAPGSKVGFRSYFEVLIEVWRIRRNVRAGRYR
jgi:dolichyl-phosphate beta-glucosyltransferase